MHGRLKVKTTAEQQEAKRKEREEKQVLYTTATKAVFAKRERKQYDKEGLEITGKLLAANPDFYTVWNIRRETITHLKNTLGTDEFAIVLKTELEFLEFCLRVNPKSYCCWYHRGWVLDTSPSPDWNKELKLCNKYLEYDERNFHCWDYRRLVVARSNVSNKDEFDFTTNKISTNFSNFSSWHYRSKLLPDLYPDSSNWHGIVEEKLLEEFELVQNAFFTDPNDQSAWFYHRWLLGKGDNALGFLSMSARFDPLVIVVTLNRPVKVGTDCHLGLWLGETNLGGVWRSADKQEYSCVWLFDASPLAMHCDSVGGVTVTVTDCQGDGQVSQQCTITPAKSYSRNEHVPGTLFKSSFGITTSNILQAELESCEQLHDMEPDNKWTLLTIISLMRALNPLQYESETYCYLDKLCVVDPMRVNYYKDLRSQFVVENALEVLPSTDTKLSLADKSLTSLPHLIHMTTFTYMDLSQNCLISLQGFSQLQCLQVLILDDNSVCSCQGLEHMADLKSLSLKNNKIGACSSLDMLTTCPRLTSIDVQGNPLCREQGESSSMHELRQALGNIKLSTESS